MSKAMVLRLALWGVVIVAGVAAGTMYVTANREVRTASSEGAALIGGPFTLEGPDGPVTDADLKGQPFAIFFGFTHCPDICPTSLFEMAGWIEELGPAAEDMNFVFVTIDPERDTPEVMQRYVGSFTDRILPLSGSPEQIDAMIQAYRVYAAKVPLDDGDYTMDHSAFIYLMGPDGAYVGHIGYGESAEKALAKLRELADAA